MLVTNLETNYLVVKILVANVSDQSRIQFIIKTILIIKLEINYNFLELF